MLHNFYTQSVGAAFSPHPPTPLPSLCFSSLQMWLREPLPWQSTQRNLLLWVILHWTSSLHIGARRRSCFNRAARTRHLVVIIPGPPAPPPRLPPPPQTPSCTHRFHSAASDGALRHCGVRGRGRRFLWRSDLSTKCQAHQKERATELIAVETEE